MCLTSNMIVLLKSVELLLLKVRCMLQGLDLGPGKIVIDYIYCVFSVRESYKAKMNMKFPIFQQFQHQFHGIELKVEE